MRCAHCKSSGPNITVAQIRDCSAGVTNPHPGGTDPTSRGATATKPDGPSWPASEPQIAYIVGLQNERMLPDEYDIMDAESLRKLEKDEASRKIQELKTLPYKEPKGAKGDKVEEFTMPEGRYALHLMDSVDSLKAEDRRHIEWRFFEVSRSDKPRWKGYTFAKRLIGAPGTYRKMDMGAIERVKVMRLIEADPKQAMIDYGLRSGVCGRCSSPLTDPESLARGLGPICAGKTGWF